MMKVSWFFKLHSCFSDINSFGMFCMVVFYGTDVSS